MALSLDTERALNRTCSLPWRPLVLTGNLLAGSNSSINPRTSVATNNVILQSFKLHRGTRQGCWLSPLLSALVLEPLTICRDPNFPGISGNHKLMLFVDDALVLISEPECSFPPLVKTMKLSGYKVNCAKSEGLPVHPSAPRPFSNLVTSLGHS